MNNNKSSALLNEIASIFGDDFPVIIVNIDLEVIYYNTPANIMYRLLTQKNSLYRYLINEDRMNITENLKKLSVFRYAVKDGIFKSFLFSKVFLKDGSDSGCFRMQVSEKNNPEEYLKQKYFGDGSSAVMSSQLLDPICRMQFTLDSFVNFIKDFAELREYTETFQSLFYDFSRGVHRTVEYIKRISAFGERKITPFDAFDGLCKVAKEVNITVKGNARGSIIYTEEDGYITLLFDIILYMKELKSYFKKSNPTEALASFEDGVFTVEFTRRGIESDSAEKDAFAVTFDGNGYIRTTLAFAAAYAESIGGFLLYTVSGRGKSRTVRVRLDLPFYIAGDGFLSEAREMFCDFDADKYYLMIQRINFPYFGEE